MEGENEMYLKYVYHECNMLVSCTLRVDALHSYIYACSDVFYLTFDIFFFFFLPES